MDGHPESDRTGQRKRNSGVIDLIVQKSIKVAVMRIKKIQISNFRNIDVRHALF
jgi:hypothetical protein